MQWATSSFFLMFIAMAMAELGSAAPTSGKSSMAVWLKTMFICDRSSGALQVASIIGHITSRHLDIATYCHG
jgi:hypothetical protein